MEKFFEQARAAFQKSIPENLRQYEYNYVGVDVDEKGIFLVGESGNANVSSPGFGTSHFLWKGETEVMSLALRGFLRLLLENPDPAVAGGCCRNILYDVLSLAKRLGVNPRGLSIHEQWLNFLYACCPPGRETPCACGVEGETGWDHPTTDKCGYEEEKKEKCPDRGARFMPGADPKCCRCGAEMIRVSETAEVLIDGTPSSFPVAGLPPWPREDSVISLPVAFRHP